MIESVLQKAIIKALETLGIEAQEKDIILEKTRDKIHGDLASNVALKFAKAANLKPLDLAHNIAKSIEHEDLEKIEVLPPGFINFHLKTVSLARIIKQVLNLDENYGRVFIGEGKKVNIEFVSANPTGRLHLGHARGAALGDSLARLFTKSGYIVIREFYVNDAGSQIENLAKSVYGRYMELYGSPLKIPEDGYYGQDIIEIAKTIKEVYGDKFKDKFDLTFFKNFAVMEEQNQINADLQYFRVNFDIFTKETSIRTDENLAHVRELLARYIYHEDGAYYLKTSSFGDDKDRVIIKSDGTYTYFFPDIAYHLDKLSRGYQYLIDLLGADHHGYIGRMQAALAMAGYPKDTLHIEIQQMVRLIKDGEEVKMSKRTGNALTLRELCEEVGVDAVRYFLVSKSASNHLDFDLDLAKQMNNANPLYYAQYAHARLCSVLNHQQYYGLDESGLLLEEDSEKELLKVVSFLPEVVKDATEDLAPYKIVNYIQKLASAIHSFYTICRIVDPDNPKLTAARLGLAKASKITLATALNLIGVIPQERM